MVVQYGEELKSYIEIRLDIQQQITISTPHSHCVQAE